MALTLVSPTWLRRVHGARWLRRARKAHRSGFVARPKNMIWGRLRFPHTFPLQNCDFGTIRANIGKSAKIVKKHVAALTLASRAWLRRVRRARWPRWACRARRSGFAVGAKKYGSGQVAFSLYFSFAKL